MDKSKLFKDVSSRTPRFGGYLKIKKDLPPSTKFNFQHRRQLVDSKSTYPVIETNDDWNLDKDAQEMLTTLIGCVMRMASNKLNVSNKRLDLTHQYLKCIKDNTTRDLPNINGLINYIISLKKSPKPLNQIGDYTYAYKHNNDVYCALGDGRSDKKFPNLSYAKKGIAIPPHENYKNYMSELQMTLRNSFGKLHY